MAVTLSVWCGAVGFSSDFCQHFGRGLGDQQSWVLDLKTTVIWWRSCGGYLAGSEL